MLVSNIQNIAQTLLNKTKEENITPNRNKASGIVSKTGDGASFFDSNNNMQEMTSSTNQSKMNYESSSSTDISYEKILITNRLYMTVDDIIVNNHRLNPDLFDLSEIKTTDLCSKGDLNIIGTVLVKCYEPTLKKNVYIRRYIRTPIVFNSLTPPVINSQFDIFQESNQNDTEDNQNNSDSTDED